MDSLYTVSLGTALGGAGYTRRHVIAAASLIVTATSVRVVFQHAATSYTITDAYIGLQATVGEAYDIDPATLIRLTQGGDGTFTITNSAYVSDAVSLVVDGSRAVVVSLYGAASQVYLAGGFPSGYSAYHRSGNYAGEADAASFLTSSSNVLGFLGLEGETPAGATVHVELQQLWGDSPQVSGELAQPWGGKTGADLMQTWSNALSARAVVYQPWGDATAIRADLLQRWSSFFINRACLEQGWNVFGVVAGEIEQRWAITADMVRGDLLQGWDLRDCDLLRAELAQRWAIEADSLDVAGSGSDGVLQYGLSVRVDGGDISVDHLNIEAGSDQDTLSCEINVGAEDDYLRCVLGAELEVIITSGSGVENFVFVITSPRITEEHGNTQYVVDAMSRGVLLGEPYAATVEGELSGLASEVATSLAGTLPITWQTVDWELPAATWIATGETPLALIKTLAASVGAVVQSFPDGSLVVAPEYPVSVDRLCDVSAVALVETLDCFTTGSTPELKSGYNKFLIGDQLSSSDGLRLEEETESIRSKLVRGYQTPWTGDFSLNHTGGSWVTIEPLGVEERQVTETVEVVAGSGRVEYPIYSRDAVSWGQVNLGSVTVSEDGSLVAAIGGESMLTITYTTRCLLWRVINAQTEQLQLVSK
jgi:hypothetical protein